MLTAFKLRPYVATNIQPWIGYVTEYIAFLRGISPTNSSMASLRECFEKTGFDHVSTILATGNVRFSATQKSAVKLRQIVEKAMEDHLGRTFLPIIRTVEYVRDLVSTDPFGAVAVADDAKKVITFLASEPLPKPPFPIMADGVCIHRVINLEAFTSYVPSSEGPVFMKMLQQRFGKDITTRTLDTVRKCVRS